VIHVPDTETLAHDTVQVVKSNGFDETRKRC
jgi:hypothetical protein